MIIGVVARQFARAVLHELYRAKAKYYFVSTLILAAAIGYAFFVGEDYRSFFKLKVNEKHFDSARATNLINDLYRQTQTKPFVDQFQTNVAKAAREKTEDVNVRKLLDEQYHFQQDGNVVVISFFADSAKRSLILANSFLEVALENRGVEREINDIETRLGYIFSERAALALEKQDLKKAIEVLQGDSGFSESVTKERIIEITQTIEEVEVNQVVVETKLESLQKQLQKEIGLKSDLSKYKNLLARNRELTQEISDKNAELSALYLITPKPTKKKATPDTAISELSVRLKDELSILNEEKALIDEGVLKLSHLQILIDQPHTSTESLYEQLRKQISSLEVDKLGYESRLSSLKKILASLKKQSASNEEQSQKVEKLKNNLGSVQIKYEGMQTQIDKLAQKKQRLIEKAEAFKVIEKPKQAEKYEGYGFREVLIIGPVFAVFIPLLMAVFAVLLDTRIRTIRRLQSLLPNDITYLEEIPHYNSPMGLRVVRNTVIGLVCWVVIVFSAYVVIGRIGWNS